MLGSLHSGWVPLTDRTLGCAGSFGNKHAQVGWLLQVYLYVDAAAQEVAGILVAQHPVSACLIDSSCTAVVQRAEPIERKTELAGISTA